MKRSAARTLLLLHFLVAIAYVAAEPLGLDPDRRWFRAASRFGAYTGAATRYGFFAPVLPAARRLRAKVLCDGAWIEVPPPVSGTESSLRLITISSLTMYPQIRRAVGASWAAHAFGRFPCAEAALVELDVYAVPSMREYRGGARPFWMLLEVMPFARADAVMGRKR